MQHPDQLHVTWDQNPAVSEAIKNAALGDKMKFEIHCTLKDRDMEGGNFTVEAIVPEGFELDEDGDEPGSTHMASTNEALMTPAAMLVKKKPATE